MCKSFHRFDRCTVKLSKCANLTTDLTDALVSIVDLFPTLAASAGVDPKRPGWPIDGVDLWPLLRGTAPHVRPFAFSEVSLGTVCAGGAIAP